MCTPALAPELICTRPLSSLAKAVAPPPPPGLDGSPLLHPHIPGPCSPSQVAVRLVTNAHAALSHTRSPQRPSEGKHSCAHLTRRSRGSEGLSAHEHRQRRAKARAGLGVCKTPNPAALTLVHPLGAEPGHESFEGAGREDRHGENTGSRAAKKRTRGPCPLPQEFQSPPNPLTHLSRLLPPSTRPDLGLSLPSVSGVEGWGGLSA